jgi:hypothetical protein
MGSSLSAALSFQRPLKSTPGGGAGRVPSLAQALMNIIAARTATRIVTPSIRRGIL